MAPPFTCSDHCSLLARRPSRGHVLDLHRTLLSDRNGQIGYRAALREVLRGGETVLDLGTGSGIHALFACEAGARRVYAVDRHEVVELARQVGCANGYANRIEWIHAPIEEVTLPEPVDVIVAHQPSEVLLTLLPDARARFLRPNGVLVPLAIELFCAPVESVRLYGAHIEFWATSPFGFDFSPARAVAANTMHDCRIEPQELLSRRARLGRFDFDEVAEPVLRSETEVEVTRTGTLHGLGVWFEQWLTPNVVLSTAPGSPLPAPLWLNGFLPVGTPVAVDRGDRVEIRIHTGPGGWGKLWTWAVTVRDRAGRVAARASHSTFSAWLLPEDVLRRQAPGYIPRLTSRGVAARLVLELCETGMARREIEDEVARRFPELCRRRGAAASFVTKIVAKYCV